MGGAGSGQVGDGSGSGSEAAGSEADDEGGDEHGSSLPLRDKLREAVAWAQMRAGRSRPARLAAAIVAGGLARQLRLARKERMLANNKLRMPLKPHPIPAAPAAGSAAAAAHGAAPVEALAGLFGHEVAQAAVAPPNLPSSPPGPEEETEGPQHAMPRAREAWAKERARQQATPFRAGARCVVEFDWVDPPPPPPPGAVWRWGAFACPKREPDLGPLMAKEVRQGAIEHVDWSDVDVVTPVFVARHPVTGKLRLVHDLRVLCARMRLSTVDYERAADALLGGTHAVKIDLLSAFRHCELGVADRRRMGFVVGGTVWRWRVLPFGAAQSPELYCAQLAAVVKRLRGEGLRLIVYVDDILILADSPDLLDVATARVMEALAEDGWYVALDKAFVTVPATTMPFLGVLVDLDTGCLRVSVAKARKLEAYCEAVLAGVGRKRQVVTLRELQKLGGTLAFLATASPLAGMRRGAIDAATAEAMKLPGRTVALRGALREEIAFWANHGRFLPGCPALQQGTGEGIAVATDAAGRPSLGWGAVAWPGLVEAPPVEEWLAGGERAGRVEGKAVAGFGRLSVPAGGALSSAALELQGFRRALVWLHAKSPGCLKGRTVTWYCDAQAAIGALRKWRSPSPGVTDELHRLFEMARRLEFTVRPVWVARELGWQPVADFLSREAERRFNSAEWRLPRAVFDAVCKEFGVKPTIDLFAAPENALCASYVTQHPAAPGHLVDAFARPWYGYGVAYAFPPFSQAARCLRHLAVARGTNAGARTLVFRALAAFNAAST